MEVVQEQGGTFNLASHHDDSDITNLDVWQGIWTSRAATFSSNWKELKTLHQTLVHEKELGGHRIKRRRLLYFTDNMVTYDIFRKGTSKSIRLWTLLLHIKIIELTLDCVVQVIHVPGTSMIIQGSDGLSRGIHMQSLASHRSNALVPLLWRAAPHSPSLLQHVLHLLPPLWPTSTHWICHSDFTDWSRSSLLGQSIFWSISPSFARQAILQALSVWIETPTTCGHIFLVPRILQRDFGRLSKFVVFCGQYTNIPLPFVPLVPFVIYIIPPFDRSGVFQHQLQQLATKLDVPPDPVPVWIKKEICNLLRVSAPN